MRGYLPNCCGRPGYARVPRSGRTLGRLSTQLSSRLGSYFVYFFDSSFLLIFRELLQGRIHDLGHFSGSLLPSCKFGFCWHLALLLSLTRSLPLFLQRFSALWYPRS